MATLRLCDFGALSSYLRRLCQITLTLQSLLFSISLLFFRFSLLFCAFFPLFSKDFRGSAKRKTLAFLGKNPCFFPKKQGLEGQGSQQTSSGLFLVFKCCSTSQKKKSPWRQKNVKVARLQSEFCTKDIFFSSHEFSYEKCSEIFPENFEPLFCGSEKIPGKFPPNFPLNFPNFPAKNRKKITDELLQERGRNFGAPSPLEALHWIFGFFL